MRILRHFNKVQRGNLAVDIKFSTAPTDAVSLVCYGEFENTIHVDSERNVVCDYSGLDEHYSDHSCIRTKSNNEQKIFAVCFLAINCLVQSTNILVDSSQTQTQAANQDCTGLASIFQRNGKEAFLTHTGSRQNFTRLRL